MIPSRYLNNLSLRARVRMAQALPMAAIVACLMLAPGCGAAPSHTAAVQVDPAFSSFVSRFQTAASAHGQTVAVTDLSVQFGQVAGESGGRGDCSVATGETPVVTISPEAWAASSDAEREELVFHELGHCLLGRTHVAGVNSDGIPSSIMNPTEITGAIYAQYRQYYLNTLFNQ